MIELSAFAALYIFMLAAFTGYEVIGKVHLGIDPKTLF